MQNSQNGESRKTSLAMEDVGLAVEEETGGIYLDKASVETYRRSDYITDVEQAAADLAEVNGTTVEEAKQWINNLTVTAAVYVQISEARGMVIIHTLGTMNNSHCY